MTTLISNYPINEKATKEKLMSSKKTILLTLLEIFFLMCSCTAMDNSQQIWQINDTSHDQEKPIRDAYAKLLTLARTNKNLFLKLHAAAKASSIQSLSESDCTYLQNNRFLTSDKKIPLIIRTLIISMVTIESDKILIISYEQLEQQEIIELIQHGGLKTSFTVSQTTITTMYEKLTQLLEENFYALECLVKICNKKSVDFEINNYWKNIKKRLIELNFLNNKGELISSLTRKLILLMVVFNYDSGEIRVKTFDELKTKGLIKRYDNRTIQERTKTKQSSKADAYQGLPPHA